MIARFRRWFPPTTAPVRTLIAMALLALTLEATRSFSDGVVFTWTPSMTDNSVPVQAEIGGQLIWAQTLVGDDSGTLDTAGDGWTLTGHVTTMFEANGINGQLDGNLNWVVEGDAHCYKGLIGLW